jgi:hypothetical protein
MVNVRNVDSYVGLLMINKLEIAWKETIRVVFEALSRDLNEGTEEIHRNFSRDIGCPCRILTGHLPNRGEPSLIEYISSYGDVFLVSGIVTGISSRKVLDV